MRFKGNKHVNVLALNLFLSECSKLSSFILYFKSFKGMLINKTVLPSLLWPISHPVAPEVKGVEMCTECQQSPTGNVLYHLFSLLLGVGVCLRTLPLKWKRRINRDKDSSYKLCTDTCNPSSKAHLNPVLYFYHNLYLLLLWLLTPAVVLTTFLLKEILPGKRPV